MFGFVKIVRFKDSERRRIARRPPRVTSADIRGQEVLTIHPPMWLSADAVVKTQQGVWKAPGVGMKGADSKWNQLSFPHALPVR